MQHNNFLVYWSVVILQVVALLGFAGAREYTVARGQEIVLQTAPVDPRDLFRGDYVVLRYEITRLKFCCFEVGETVYVSLAPAGEVWQAAGVSRNVPADGRPFIRGRVVGQRNTPAGREIDLEYGIESYFVPEGQGREIERQRQGIRVLVAVDGFGTGVIKRLLLGAATSS